MAYTKSYLILGPLKNDERKKDYEIFVYNFMTKILNQTVFSTFDLENENPPNLHFFCISLVGYNNKAYANTNRGPHRAFIAGQI